MDKARAQWRHLRDRDKVGEVQQCLGEKRRITDE